MSRAFDELSYDEFRRLASDKSLTPNERIGFPDAYRTGFDALIFNDILQKLTRLQGSSARVLDIGPGCSALPRLLIDHCVQRGYTLALVDSPEMLGQLPDAHGLTKFSGFYPDETVDLMAMKGQFDAILCYSVFHYLFAEGAFWRFLDCSIELLAPGGQMLIGDIPNVSKRKRFFASEAGIKFHQSFMQTDEIPDVDFRSVEFNRIDDAVLLGVIMRARAQGCDAYWLPQAEGLPMANRREDLLIAKP